MPKIPDEYKRVVEDQIDALFEKHFKEKSDLAKFLLADAFPGAVIESIDSVHLHVHRDHRKVSFDPLAYGETDVEIVATLAPASSSTQQVSLLMENKVDAGQMPQQGKRYQARAKYRKSIGDWSAHYCLLVAPRAYVANQYPTGAHKDHGWDGVVSYEDVAAILNSSGSTQDANVFIEATTIANAWNKPIPAAVKFWTEYSTFALVNYPTVPVSIRSQKGSRAGGVWPSFYDDALRDNKTLPKRKNVQIVHIDNSAHLALFLKKVGYEDFINATAHLLEEGMAFGPKGKSWQSIRVPVPIVDPSLPFNDQSKALHSVFHEAQHLYEFFIRKEEIFLSIPSRQ